MWGLLNTFSAPVKSAANQFLRNQASAAVRKTGLETLRRARSGSGLASELAALRLSANTPLAQGTGVTVGGLAAADVSNRSGLTGQIEGALNQVGPALDRFFSGTPQAIQQFGREQEKKGWAGALELASPLGFLAAPFIPNTPAAKPRMPGLPVDYKQTELAAGAAAERFRPGAGFPGQQAAADRAYQQEKERVAQLTAQDPELQRYENARKAAKTQEEMNAARDIGMAIWARSNPKLAAKVKPGQSGYEVIQNEINAGQMGPVTDLPFDTTKPFSPTPIPPEQQSVTYEGVRPAMLGEVTPITGGGFPTQQAAMFERFRQSIAPESPSFQGSPLGTNSPLVGNLSYTGSIAPLGTAVEGGDFRSEQAQKLAEMFKKAQFAG